MIPKRLASTLVVALLSTLAVACNGGNGTSDTSDPNAGEKPFQSEWEMVVNAPFPLADIGNVTIGRKEYMENFANRGDVEVFFDLPTETITIEMRRYAFQLDQAEADDTFSRIQPWAFVASGSPKKPSEMDPADDCTAAWQEGCAFYVYYDGQSQPARTGADIRVHLPAAYRAKVFVETEDNTTETLYPLRGDVKLQNLCGSGDVRVSSGVVDVFLCRELTPGPTCSADAISKCETWQIDDGMGNMVDAPWDSTCPCTSFGALKVEALDPYAANVTVDIPNSVWAYINLDNRKSGQTPDGYHCTAEVDPSVCGAGCTVTQSPETRGRRWSTSTSRARRRPRAPATASTWSPTAARACSTPTAPATTTPTPTSRRRKRTGATSSSAPAASPPAASRRAHPRPLHPKRGAAPVRRAAPLAVCPPFAPRP